MRRRRATARTSSCSALGSILSLFLICAIAGCTSNGQQHRHHAPAHNILETKGRSLELLSPLTIYYLATAHPDFDVHAIANDCWFDSIIGIWRVHDERLWLVDVKPCGRTKSLMPELFRDQQKGILVPADWYSGTLRAGTGRVLETDGHHGFVYRYSKELYLAFENGRLVGSLETSPAGKDEYRSVWDLRREAMSPLPEAAAADDWVDLRSLVAEPETYQRREVTTRGLISRAVLELEVPSSHRACGVQVTLSYQSGLELPEGRAVEVTGRLIDAERGAFLVQRMRRLEPKESIHHPKFATSVNEHKACLCQDTSVQCEEERLRRELEELEGRR